MNITFRQLKLFKLFSETLSVTATARAIHVTQPTASMQLKELNQAVGLPLYEQVGKKIYLTEAGKALALTAQSISIEWENFEQTIASMKGLRTGKLKISVVSTAKYFIPKLVGSFCKAYPNVEIALEVLNRDAVVSRLEANLDDMVIMTRPPQHLEIEDEIFLDNPLVCVASKHSPLVDKKLTLEDLVDQDFIMREQGSGTRMSCELFFKKNNFHPKIRLSLGSNEAIKQSVASGLGLSILSIHSLTEFDLQDDLAILEVSGLPIESQWHIVTLKGRKLCPIGTVFHQHLLDKVKEIRLNTFRP
jgi:LysR family transcriptional regulator, low CO2-responsive transcriptional regulator